MATRKSKPSPARKRTAKATKPAKVTKPAKKSAAKPAKAAKAAKAAKKSAAKKSAGKVVKKRTTPRPRRRTGESGPPDGGDKG